MQFGEEECLRRLHDIAARQHTNNCDVEQHHMNADNALCAFLEGLGYKHIVAAYQKIEKLYS